MQKQKGGERVYFLFPTKWCKRSSTAAPTTPETSLGWTPTPHHQVLHPTDPQCWLCWSSEQTPWSAIHLLTICPNAEQQAPGNPRWTASFTPGKISRQNKLPSCPQTSSQQLLYFTSWWGKENTSFWSPSPSSQGMSDENTGNQHRRSSNNLLADLLSFHTWLECLGNSEKPWQVTSPPNPTLSHLCHKPHRPIIQLGLEKKCRDASVYHQELLPFYHIICDLLHIKRINSLVFPSQHVQETQHNNSSLYHSNGRKWQWHDR